MLNLEKVLFVFGSNKGLLNTMDKNWQKIKILTILFLVKLTRKTGQFLHLLLQATYKLFVFVFLFIFKILVFPFLPFYLKIKKSLGSCFSNFHYAGGILSLFAQKNFLFVFLFLILAFVFFETKASLGGDFLAQAIILEEKKEETILPDFRMAIDEEIALRPINVFEYDFIPTRAETEEYLVQSGETVSQIAEKFGVSVNTILWENNLSSRSIIRPDQTLRILPVSGIRHKIAQGDSIQKIAQRYRTDSENILKFNDLDEKRLVVGQTIIVPDGSAPPPPPPPPQPIIRRATSADKSWIIQYGGRTRVGTSCRDFYPGQCTWYVAQRYCLTFSGHARNWLANASRAGYQIGNTPRVGAIVSTLETWWGHVGIVEEIRGNTLIISEMNHRGPWVASMRELSINDRRINGYIYPPEIF